MIASAFYVGEQRRARIRIIREVSSRLRAAVSPFLTGKITKGEPQVEHLFKRDGSWELEKFVFLVLVGLRMN